MSLLSVMTRTNLLVHLHHRVGEGMYPSCGTPHRVGGQTVVKDRTKVGAVHCLELIIIRVAAETEGGEREGRSRDKMREREGVHGRVIVMPGEFFLRSLLSLP